MSFDKLIHKVAQAENALEARERSLGADWRQLKSSWREAWTPGRIVIAGLVGGFLTGRAEPLGRTGGSALRLASTLSSLFATASARSAADEAEDAADEVHGTDAIKSSGIDGASRQHAVAERAAVAESAEP